MNKQYKVTVNGKIFDVNVEEVAEGAVVQQSAPAPVVEQPVVVEQPKQPEVVAPQPAGGNVTQITSPMPGNIWKIVKKPNEKVNKHETILILEVMKIIVISFSFFNLFKILNILFLVSPSNIVKALFPQVDKKSSKSVKI